MGLERSRRVFQDFFKTSRDRMTSIKVNLVHLKYHLVYAIMKIHIFRHKKQGHSGSRLLIHSILCLLYFLSVSGINAQIDVNKPGCIQTSQNINLSLPSGTKVFYVNIMDSAGNSVSTNLVNIGETFIIDSLTEKHILFDPAVWVKPQIYNDAPDSLKYPGEKAFYYEGLDYLGHKTKVFAYIGFPANASSNDKVPAVVLVHGGGGTAYPQWVKIWNDQGYAAFAMDLEGHLPGTPGIYPLPTHDFSGPPNTNYSDINMNMKDQWMYHAVADAYLAYSLLASDERVDKSRIGITGISWGGLITSIAIGNSDCFAFAIPVYGCGYLNTSKGFFKGIYNDTVSRQWEASNWLQTVKTPTLWINGDSDTHFSVEATSKSAQTVKNSMVTIIPNYPHSHSDGWFPKEIYSFANSVVKDSKGLIRILKQPTEDDLTIIVDTHKSFGVKSAVLIYSKQRITYDKNSKLSNVWLQKPIKVKNEKHP